jgi:hypothetical protein
MKSVATVIVFLFSSLAAFAEMTDVTAQNFTPANGLRGYIVEGTCARKVLLPLAACDGYTSWGSAAEDCAYNRAVTRCRRSGLRGCDYLDTRFESIVDAKSPMVTWCQATVAVEGW